MKKSRLLAAVGYLMLRKRISILASKRDRLPRISNESKRAPVKGMREVSVS